MVIYPGVYDSPRDDRKQVLNTGVFLALIPKVNRTDFVTAQNSLWKQQVRLIPTGARTNKFDPGSRLGQADCFITLLRDQFFSEAPIDGTLTVNVSIQLLDKCYCQHGNIKETLDRTNATIRFEDGHSSH